MNKKEMLELSEIVANAVVIALKKEGLVGNASANPKIKSKSAYQKTETLLYKYNDFKKILVKANEQIKDLKKYGVPKKDGSIVSFGGHNGLPQGIMLEQETVENATHEVEKSVRGVLKAINLVDNSLAALKRDPYYSILEMRYFEGRTQEDIAVELGCDQGTVSRNRSRLINELSLVMFPNDVANELM